MVTHGKLKMIVGIKRNVDIGTTRGKKIEKSLENVNDLYLLVLLCICNCDDNGNDVNDVMKGASIGDDINAASIGANEFDVIISEV